MDAVQNEAPADAQVQTSRGAGIFRFFVDILETLLLSALLFLGINAISARIRVDGHSMQPTLYDGEFVVVNKLAYKFGEPQRGDVIVFRFPRDTNQEYIKRIIGLPGDHVKIQLGRVLINDEVLTESYIAAPPNYQSEWTVPEGSLFVLGDNRNNSSDSHSWGPVAVEYVVGKALFVYWPLNKWGVIDHPPIASAAP